jgi:hypothetical protein
MKADAKFGRSREVFADEWLRLPRLNGSAPNPAIYGITATQFSAIKPHMIREVHEFIKYVDQQNMPLETLLDARFSIMSKELADYYGFAHSGIGYQRINFSPTDLRAGLSTMGGIVAMNSNTDRRSIILSGVWFLNAMLCDDPPSPTEDLSVEIANALASTSTHRALAAERAGNTRCASCHTRIDPAGLAFTHIDSAGRKTDRDEMGRTVETFGEIYAKPFRDVYEFLQVAKNEAKFKACLTTKMMIYGTGQTLNPKGNLSDRCKVDQVVKKVNSADHFNQLILETVLSESFLKRRIPN